MKHILHLLIFMILGFAPALLFGQHRKVMVDGTLSEIRIDERSNGRDTLVFPQPQAERAWYVTFPERNVDCNHDYLHLYKGNLLNARFRCHLPESFYEKGGFSLVVISEGLKQQSKLTVQVRLIQIPQDLPVTSQPKKGETIETMAEGCPPVFVSTQLTINNSEEDRLICKGNCIDLIGSGMYTSVVGNDFNSNTIAPLIERTNAVLGNGCGSYDGSQNLWFGSNETVRYAETQTLNLIPGGYLSFMFRFGTDSLFSLNGCEDADLPIENVQVQVWNSGSWFTLSTLSNNGNLPNGFYDRWRRVCVPYGSYSGNRKFRIVQEAHSGIGYDQWAIDDISIDIQREPILEWQYPDGTTVRGNRINVCPLETSTYILKSIDHNNNVLRTMNVRVPVIDPLVISGTLTTPESLYCENARPRPLTVSSYNGRVLAWEYALNCDGRWFNGGGAGFPTYTPSILGQDSVCYRAKVGATGCEAYTNTIRLYKLKDRIGNIRLSKDSVCVGETVTLSVINTNASVIRWEWSNDNRNFFPLNVPNTNPVQVNVWADTVKCFRALVNAPSCLNPLTAFTSSNCFKHIGKPSLVQKRIGIPECQVPTYRLFGIGVDSVEIIGWERQLPDGTWELIPNTEGKVAWVSNTYLPVGSIYRIRLNPNLRKNKCDPPIPYTLSTKIPVDMRCCCMHEDSVDICQGEMIRKQYCVNQNCAIPQYYQLAYNPSKLDCYNPSLVYLPLPDSLMNPITGCLTYERVVQNSFCIRVVLADPLDQNVFFVGRIARISTYRTIQNVGNLVVEPAEVCFPGNNGLVSIRNIDPSLTIVRWEQRVYRSNLPFTTLQGVRGDSYAFNNISEPMEYRVVSIDSLTGCTYTTLPVDVLVYPNGQPGRLSPDILDLCPDNTGLMLFLSAHRGTIMRWERSIGSCNGPWAIEQIASQNNQVPALVKQVNIPQTICFRAVVRYQNCPEMFSEPALVRVNSFPGAGYVSGSATICAGVPGPVMTLNGYSGGTVVRWESSTQCNTFGSPVSVSNTANTYQAMNIAQPTCFRAVVANHLNCESYSRVARIDIIPESMPGELTSPTPKICPFQRSSVQLTETTGSIMYWESSDDGGQNWTRIQTTTRFIQTPVLTRTTCYRAWVRPPVCNPTPTTPLCIEVAFVGSDDAQLIYQGTDTLCAGDYPMYLNYTLTSGAIMAVQGSANCQLNNWQPYGYTLHSQNRIIITNQLSETTCFRLKINRSGCTTNYSPTVKVNVHPPGRGVISTPQTICLGQIPQVLTLSNTYGDVVRWEWSEDNVDWYTIPNSRNLLSYQPPVLTRTTYYRAVMRKYLCPESATGSVKITVNNAQTQAGILSANQTKCKDEIPNLLTLSNNTGTILNWEKSIGCNGSWSSFAHQGLTYQPDTLKNKVCYRVAVRDNNCSGTLYSNTITLEVLTPVQYKGTLIVEKNVCQFGESAELKVIGINGNIVKWQESEDGQYWVDISHTGASYLVRPLTNSFYRVVIAGGNGCYLPYSNPVFITIPDPVRGGNLSPNQTICTGERPQTLQLSNYFGNIVRWESSVNGSDWNDTGNIGSNSFDPPVLTQNTYYRVALNNNVGCPIQTTEPIYVVVSPMPIGGILSGGTTFCENQNAPTLTLSRYVGQIENWESSTDGNTWNTLVYDQEIYIPSFQPSQTKLWLRVKVKDLPCGNTYSNAIEINRFPTPYAGKITYSGSNTICLGMPVPPLKLVDNLGTILKWESSSDSLLWQTIPIVTTSTYQPHNLVTTTWYRVTVSGDVRCGSLFSLPVKITVRDPNNPFQTGFVTGDQTVCEGEPALPISVSRHSIAILRWEKSVGCSDSWTTLNDRSNNLSPGILSETTCFRAVFDNLPCNLLYGNVVQVSIQKRKVVGTLVGDQTICLAGQETALQVVDLEGTISIWEESTDSINWTPILDFDDQIIVQPMQTTYYRVVIQNLGGGCLASHSSVARVTVNNLIETGNLTSNQTVCENENPVPLTLTGHQGVILRWESSTDGTQWTPVGHVGITNFAPQNLTRNTYYRVVLGSYDCPEVNTEPVLITVIPLPDGGTISGTATVCAGQNVHLTLSGVNGSVIYWESSDNQWQNITVIANTTHTLIHSQNQAVARRYRAKTRVVCGEVISKDFTVTSEPNPELITRLETPCGMPFRLVVTSNIPNTTFSLQPPVLPPNQTGIFIGIPSDNYMVTGRTANGCSTDVPISVYEQSPPVPVILGFNYPSPINAVVYWSRVPGINVTYRLRYRKPGSNWIQPADTRDTFMVLYPLTANTIYEAEIVSLCNGKPSIWSGKIKQFRTPNNAGDCLRQPPPPPSNIRINYISTTNANVSWSAVGHTIGYILSYGPASLNPNAWNQLVICHPDTAFTLRNLSPNTDYSVRLRTNCSNCTTALNVRDIRSNWSDTYNFTTLTHRNTEVGQKNQSEFSLYPNPANESFTLQFETETSFRVALTDVTGKSIMSKELNNKGSHTFDTSELPAGIYLVIAYSSKGDVILFTEKVVITR